MRIRIFKRLKEAEAEIKNLQEYIKALSLDIGDIISDLEGEYITYSTFHEVKEDIDTRVSNLNNIIDDMEVD